VAADHLYRIASDAVAASVRRGGCTRIAIRLTSTVDRLTLTVDDDARGPEPTGGAGEFGLRMIGYRARLLGGSARLARLPDGDGRCEVSTPLQGGGHAARRDP